MACTCHETINAKLADHNGKLEFNLLNPRFRALIATCKKVTHTTGKKRFAKPPKVLASYCPFCGKPYP